MKMTLLLVSVSLLLTASAKAQIAADYESNSLEGNLMRMSDRGSNASAKDYADMIGFKGDIPKDGPVTMSKDFSSSSSDGEGFSGLSNTWTNTTKISVNVTLVMKDGKVSGVVGTMQRTATVQTDSNSFGKVTHDAPVTDTSTYTFMQKSFDKSASKQVADIAKQQNPSGKKAPSSIPSSNGGGGGGGGGGGSSQNDQNVQQNVQTSQSISPSAP